MDQNTLKIKALNPVTKSKIPLIIESISKLEGLLSIEFNEENTYFFIFTTIIKSDYDAIELTGRMRELLRFHASSILSINK